MESDETEANFDAALKVVARHSQPADGPSAEEDKDKAAEHKDC